MLQFHSLAVVFCIPGYVSISFINLLYIKLIKHVSIQLLLPIDDGLYSVACPFYRFWLALILLGVGSLQWSASVPESGIDHKDFASLSFFQDFLLPLARLIDFYDSGTLRFFLV